MTAIKKLPLAVSGLSLSLAALGNLLAPRGDAVRYLCGALSAVLLIGFILKLILDFKSVREELKNPIVLSIFPTSTMALMLLCAYVKPYVGAAVYVWYLALAAHVLIMLLFFKRFVLSFKIGTVFPSWFLAAVGIVVASVTSPAMNARPMGQVIFWVGFVLYFAVLPVVLYRLIKVKPLPEPSRPTIAIFTAPMSLCIAGYFQAYEQVTPLLVYIMLAIAVVSYIGVIISMFWLLRLKFYPTYAAFTFPVVISAVAFKAANAFLVRNGASFFSFAPELTEWIAIVMVAYVLIRYIVFLATPKKKPEAVAK